MFWKRKEKSLIKKAHEVDEVLSALGVEPNTETGKQIRGAIAMELLGQKYDLMDKHSKAHFIKTNHDVVTEVRDMLINEGILTQQKAIGTKENVTRK